MTEERLPGGAAGRCIDSPDPGITSHYLPPLSRFRFELEALERLELPEFEGSALRGLIGHGLRAVACVTRQPRCQGCLLATTCVYARIFETLPHDRLPLRGADAPNPYVIAIETGQPRRIARGETFSFGMTLIGGDTAILPFVTGAIDWAGKRGIGKRQGRFALAAVWQAPHAPAPWEMVYSGEGGRLEPRGPAHPPTPPRPEAVRVVLETPLRLKRRGRLLTPNAFEPRDLFQALRQRATALQFAFGDPDGPTAETVVPREALAVPAREKRLRWFDWARYSSRQETLMNMGGITGEFTVSGRSLAAIWPLLWWGQWVHAGKATALGLGAYRLEAKTTLD